MSSKAIVISSDSLSKPSTNDYQPAKESQDAQDDDMDMEGSEIISRKSSIGVIDSEYEQDLSSRKRKVKWSQVGNPKQKTSTMPLDSKDQASKQSKMVTSKVQKAHGTSSRKVGCCIPLSPTHVLSDDAGPQKDTHSDDPCNKSTNTAQVVLIGSDSTCSTVTPTPAQGVPQTNVPDPCKESGKTQSARSNKPDPHKEYVNTVKALVAPLTSNSTHCTTAHVNSNNINTSFPDTPGILGGISNGTHLLAGPGVSANSSAFVASTVLHISHEPYYGAPVQLPNESYDKKDAVLQPLTLAPRSPVIWPAAELFAGQCDTNWVSPNKSDNSGLSSEALPPVSAKLLVAEEGHVPAANNEAIGLQESGPHAIQGGVHPPHSYSSQDLSIPSAQQHTFMEQLPGPGLPPWQMLGAPYGYGTGIHGGW
ncbi:hypothetical protein SCLCIDRAFT_12275 [Scleroderma citrinum Foug A]|uniref:Uncharacterized protein n=1 Tax=Scleroderma citrinum Foug A TaxID=1036808 RepID=A0A0C3D403_9AGAM|nr:hypothetical protein SCLCIDRAFT_12275 [Scleroderma citrinum Foug A]